MHLISKSQSILYKNSENCLVQEYPSAIKAMDGATATIRGRYPETGFAMNQISHEVAYVIRGEGTIETENETYVIHEGDVVMMPPGEYFAWNGNLELFIACTPAFDLGQYRHKE